MEDFIENFDEFREWLLQARDNGMTPTYDEVVDRFRSLGLDKAF